VSSVDLDADKVRRLLELQPHSTCGFVRISFVSGDEIAPSGLPEAFAAGRPLGSASRGQRSVHLIGLGA